MFSRLVDKWQTFWNGEPCHKHPGHRVREFGIAGMCRLCFIEKVEIEDQLARAAGKPQKQRSDRYY